MRSICQRVEWIMVAVMKLTAALIRLARLPLVGNYRSCICARWVAFAVRQAVPFLIAETNDVETPNS